MSKKTPIDDTIIHAISGFVALIFIIGILGIIGHAFYVGFNSSIVRHASEAMDDDGGIQYGP